MISERKKQKILILQQRERERERERENDFRLSSGCIHFCNSGSERERNTDRCKIMEPNRSIIFTNR